MPSLPSAPFLQQPCATRALEAQPPCLLCTNPSLPKRWNPLSASPLNPSSTAHNLPAHPSPPLSPLSSPFPNPCSEDQALQSHQCFPLTWWHMHPRSQGAGVGQPCAHGRQPVPTLQF